MPGEGSPFTKEGIKLQVKRLEEFKEILDHISKDASNLIVLGDVNIDQRQENSPLNRPEIRALQPILERMMLKHGLKRINKEPTHFFPQQKPSLFDLILSNEP